MERECMCDADSRFEPCGPNCVNEIDPPQNYEDLPLDQQGNGEKYCPYCWGRIKSLIEVENYESVDTCPTCARRVTFDA